MHRHKLCNLLSSYTHENSELRWAETDRRRRKKNVMMMIKRYCDFFPPQLVWWKDENFSVEHERCGDSQGQLSRTQLSTISDNLTNAQNRCIRLFASLKLNTETKIYTKCQERSTKWFDKLYNTNGSLNLNVSDDDNWKYASNFILFHFITVSRPGRWCAWVFRFPLRLFHYHELGWARTPAKARSEWKSSPTHVEPFKEYRKKVVIKAQPWKIFASSHAH